MKALWIGLVGVLLAGVPEASAQSWLAAGAQWNQLQGAGEGDNTFREMGQNQGYTVELGLRGKGARWAFVFEGDWYKTINTVGVSAVDVTFVVPVTMEVRAFLVKRGAVQPFIGAGVGWSRMKFERMQGADNQVLLPVSAGIQFSALRAHLLAQPIVRYYAVTLNSLGQTSGMQAAALLGLTW